MQCGNAHLAAWRLCGTGGRWRLENCCAALAGWERAWRQAGRWWRLSAASPGAARTPAPAPAPAAATPSELRAAGAAATGATGWAGASPQLPHSRCKWARLALPAELLLGPGWLWRPGCGGLSRRKTGTAGSQCCRQNASVRQCRRPALSGPQTEPGDAAPAAAAAAVAAAPRATRAAAAAAPGPPWEAPLPPLPGAGAASAPPRPAVLLTSRAASPQSGRAGGSCCWCCCCR